MAKSKNLRDKIRLRQGTKCCYCECEMVICERVRGRPDNPKTETLEHLKRKEEGGGNELDNLALSCFLCNVGRGRMDWLTYKSYIMGEIYDLIGGWKKNVTG